MENCDPRLGELNVHISKSETAEGRYDVAYVDIPARDSATESETSQALLDMLKECLLKDFNGTLIESRTLTLRDYPGGEAIVAIKRSGHSFQNKVRYFLVHNRFYIVFVLILKDRTFTEKMDAFLQSFTPTVKAPANWQAFKSEAGNFTVQVPPDLKLTETTQEVDSVNLHIFASDTGEGSYSILYYDYPLALAADPAIVQGQLDTHRAGWLRYIKGTSIEERAVSMGNHPGREIIAEGKVDDLPVKIKARYFLVHNRFYQINARILKDGKFTEEMEAFLQSFALLKDSDRGRQ